MRNKENYIYIAKILGPWMVDELIAFSNITNFVLILLQKPGSKYIQQINNIKLKGVTIYEAPFNNCFTIKKIWLFICLFISNILKYTSVKNFIFSIKSFYWYLKLDKTLIPPGASIHAQFATEATIVSYLLKKYYDNSVEYSFTTHAYDIFFKNKWLKTLVKNAKYCFSISEFNIQYLKKTYRLKCSNIILSRLGVFVNKNFPDRKYNKTEIFKVGFLSWFEKKKGIFNLLEAFVQIKKEKLPIKLILAGDGKLKKEIVQYIEKYNLNEDIELPGALYGNDKKKFFRDIDVFILPSIKVSNDMDGIPVVLMEALNFKLPLISTNLSGIPEICFNNKNGILLYEADPDFIKKTIFKLFYKREELLKLSENSSNVLAKYNLAKNSIQKLNFMQWN